MVPALIIIDLQNDFVSPTGALKDKHIRSEELISHLLEICEALHTQQVLAKIVFVKSEYNSKEWYQENPPRRDDGFRAQRVPQLAPSRGNELEEELQRREGDASEAVIDDHLSGTHAGKRKFCAPNSPGTKFAPEIARLIHECGDNAKVVTKNWYSAFTETGLHDWLQQQNVGQGPLYFAGVTANNCVLASLTDAFFLGYRVKALKECIGATSDRLLEGALKKIKTYYGDVVSVQDFLADMDVNRQKEYGGNRTLYWVNGSIPSWRVMLCLAHKGIPYHRKRLHVMSTPKETRNPEFLSVNPRGKTPVLIDEDGTVIAESMAILQYLEAYYPEVATLPDPIKEKEEYKVTLQRFHESENLHNVFGDIELLFKNDWKTDTRVKEHILETHSATLRELRFWEHYLSTSPYVAGNELSLADFATYPNVAYLIHRGMDLDREGLPRLKEYHKRMKSLPCAGDALPIGYENVAKTNLFKRLYSILDEEIEMEV